MKILISGPGLIGKKHASLIRSNPDTELLGIIAPNSAENKTIAKEFNVPWFEDLEHAISSADVDAVILSSPNNFHFEQAKLCLKSGIPVLVEKPVTDSLKSAYQLSVLQETTKVPLLVGHHRTYSPLVDQALGFINSDLFGRKVAFSGSALFYKPDRYFVDGPWRALPGGGPLLINLIHEIGLWRVFFGEIEYVTALSCNNLRKFAVEDSATISFKFQNGALGSFILSDIAASSKSWEMTSGENPSYPFFPRENSYHMAGTTGSLDFPTLETKTYGAEGEKSWWEPLISNKITRESADPLELQLQHFVRVVRGHEQVRVSARDGFMNMLVLEAIMASVNTGETVLVEQILKDLLSDTDSQ